MATSRRPPGSEAVSGGEGRLRGHVRQRARFQAILDIGRALGSTLKLSELLTLVMQRITAVMGADRSTLFLVDEKTGELWSVIAQGTQMQEIRLPRGQGVAGWVAEHGTPLNIRNAYDDPRFDPETDRRTGYLTGSIFSVPFTDKAGQTAGVIQVLDRRRDSFSSADEQLLTSIAAQVAVAIENAKLYEAVVAKNVELTEAHQKLWLALAELDVLYAIEKQISDAEGLDAILDGVVHRAQELCEAEAGAVLLLDEEGGFLSFEAVCGPHAERLRRQRLRLGAGITGRAAERGEAVVVNDVPSHPDWIPRVGDLELPVRTLMCVPIRADGAVIGMIELLDKKNDRHFDESDVRLVTLVAGQTARAIAVGRGREERERKARLASVGQMMSTVLHDLKTPMTVISGYAELMAGDENADRRLRSSELIQKQFEHIAAMTREVLQFVKGERELLVTKVYLHQFIEEVAEYLRRDFEGRGVDLVVEPVYRGTARFDENKVKRLVYNLARNAGQAMAAGGRFTMRFDKVDTQLQMTFADTGPGIPPEIAGRLFQAFVTQGKKDGTGLGLAMVKKAVDDHGGTVACDSVPGRGTTFTVCLPLDPA